MSARRIAACVVAMVVVSGAGGCGAGSSETGPSAVDDPVGSAEPTAAPADPAEPPEATEPAAATVPGWDEVVSDATVGADDRVYVAGPAGVAATGPDGEWEVFDVDQLPAGAGAPFPADWPPGLPGRMIDHVAVGPDNEVWAAGVSFSRVDDEQFGGEVNPYFDARFLDWIAVGDCDSGPCEWHVFTSDDETAISNPLDLVVGPDGTMYAAAEENTLLVHDHAGWESHVVPGTPSEMPWSESLAVAPDGTLWAGTTSGQGLYSFDGTDLTLHRTDQALPGGTELQVSAGPDGTIWVATDMLDADPVGNPRAVPPGIASFDGDTWTTYTTDDGLMSNDGSVVAGPDSVVWAVHHQLPDYGYSRFDGTAWTTYPVEHPLAGSPAGVTSDGSLWTVALDAHHTDAVVPAAGLLAFDGTTETVHPWPFG